MKITFFVIGFLMLGTFADFESRAYNPEEKVSKEQILELSPNPANNFLDIKINTQIIGHNANVVRCEVKVLNKAGILVFSSVKQTYQFNIFTGGWPDGDYLFQCKLDTVQVQKEFTVKH